MEARPAEDSLAESVEEPDLPQERLRVGPQLALMGAAEAAVALSPNIHLSLESK